MNVDDIIKKWHVAAFRAECETEDRFDHQMCNIKNTDGVTECPICYFSKRLRYHLDLDAAQQGHQADADPGDIPFTGSEPSYNGAWTSVDDN